MIKQYLVSNIAALRLMALIHWQADDMLAFDEYGAMFEGLQAGMCVAAVAGDNEYRVYIEGSAAQYTVSQAVFCFFFCCAITF
jgi:hypothetical protein